MATPYARRQFAGGSIVTTVPLAIGANDGSFTLAASTSWPDGSVGNFVIVLDFGNSTQEKVLCSARSGLVVTVAASGRGYDGTSAVAHNAGCSAQVVHCAQDDDEANQVVSAVLGQANAAKGDILAMLSAAGPNTLTRIPITNGAVLGAASSLPAWSAAGTAGQLLASGGTGVPTWTTKGSNLGAVIATSEGTNSNTYTDLATAGPAVTLTTNTLVKVTLTASHSTTQATGASTLMGFAVSGATTTAAADTAAAQVYWASNGGIITVSAVFYTTVTAGSNTFTAKYKAIGNNATFANRNLIVECLN